jgi:hypothetical protein
MTGQIKRIIDHIIAERAKGNATLVNTTRTKLVLKGVNPAKFMEDSPDDPVILQKLQDIAREMNIQLRT